MFETINQILDFLIANYSLYMVVTMSVIMSITIGLLTIIKKPIKCLTGKISNERLRHLVNKIFIIMAFGISAMIWFALGMISPEYFTFEPFNAFLTGALSVVLYALFDGVITHKTANELIEDIIVDMDNTKSSPTKSKENKNTDINSAVNEFLKKVK